LTLFDPDLAPSPEAARTGSAEPGAVRPEGAGDAAGLAPPTVRLRLVVAYDGSGFRGFAAQPGQRTVAGELARALATVTRQSVELTCAGRTDAGVHATGQVVHTDVPAGTDTARLVRSVNAMLGPAVAIRSAGAAPPGFDARRSALARHYRYLVLEAPTPDPLLAPIAWHVTGPLDLRAMAAAADTLLGEHDFRALCRRVPGSGAEEPIVRRVLDARWSEVRGGPGDVGEGARLLRFDIAARSFCHQMVRAAVGVLVDVGHGRRTASDMAWIVRSGDRAHGSDVAPPHGLSLTAVDYDG